MKPLEEISDHNEVAVRWAVRRAAGLSEDEEEELTEWMEADPRHYAAFAEADLAMNLLAPKADPKEREELRTMLSAPQGVPPQRRSGWVYAAACMAAALILGFFLWSSPEPTPAAWVARPLVQTLPDGSTVELNAGAEIVPHYSPAIRGITLLKGEALFAVAKDPSRPFIVSVGPVKVRAVGTAFNVRYHPETVEVLVTEGKVKITDESPMPGRSDPVSGPSATRETDLTAGQRTVIALTPEVPAPLVAQVTSAEIQRELSWREMRFELTNATLEETVRLFNLKGRTQLEIADPELKERRLSGIYWADNPAQFAEMLEGTLEIKAVRMGNDRIILRKP